MIKLSDKLSYLLIPSAEIIRHRISLFLLHQTQNGPLALFSFYAVSCCVHISSWNHEGVCIKSETA